MVFFQIYWRYFDKLTMVLSQSTTSSLTNYRRLFHKKPQVFRQKTDGFFINNRQHFQTIPPLNLLYIGRYKKVACIVKTAGNPSPIRTRLIPCPVPPPNYSAPPAGILRWLILLVRQIQVGKQYSDLSPGIQADKMHSVWVL